MKDDAATPLPGGSFEDYLASLPSKRRVAVRHERAAFHKTGLSIRHLPLGDCFWEAGPHRHYKKRLPFTRRAASGAARWS
jgi:hypothetical protein